MGFPIGFSADLAIGGNQKLVRRLAAILAADVVDYSLLMSEDEVGTIAALTELRRELFEPTTAERGGTILKSMGDGWLVEYPSVSDAVGAAIKVQKALDRHVLIQLRIGIHIGEVTFTDEDIYGDGINVAARLEVHAQPGEIMISDTVHHSLDGKAVAEFSGGETLQLKNIPRPVTVWRWSNKIGSISSRPAPQTMRMPEDKPVIAVLPFDNMSSDPEQEHFADGIAEDIITVLSRFRSFSVIARNSTFTYKGRAVDIKKAAQELGATHVIEGSVRRAGSRLRITVQLIDAATGDHVWAERYDRQLEDIFDVQDEITERVAMAVGPEIQAFDLARAQRKDTSDLSTWEILSKVAWHYQRLTDDDCAAAALLLENVLDSDPNNAAAFVWSSSIQTMQYLHGWARPKDESLALALANAQTAIRLDANSEFSQTSLGTALFFSKKHKQAQDRFRAATKINPNFVDAISVLGMSFVYTHDFEAAEENLKRAVELSPKATFTMWVKIHFCFMHFVMRDFDKALEKIQDCLIEYPNVPTCHRIAAAVHGQMGNLEAAAEAYSKFAEFLPDDTIRETMATTMFIHQEDIDLYAEGLRRAGMPE